MINLWRLALAVCAGTALGGDAGTNVVILLADDLGYGDPGYQGGFAHTPHLDAMSTASSTIQFSRFYCGGAVCSPTRASILTGRTPNRACIWDYISLTSQMHLPHNEFTLADAASTAGMASLHTGKWHLGHFAHNEPTPLNATPGTEYFNLTTPAHVGFEEYYSTMPLKEISTTFNCGCFDPENEKGLCIEGHWGPQTNGCDYFHSGVKSSPETVVKDTEPMVKDGYGADDAELIMDKFEAFANASVAKGKAFLAVVWFQNVHVQYTAVEKYTSLYPVGPTITPLQQDFWGSLSAMDAQIGRCRAILKTLGVAENTIVWFTSDNGPEVNQPGTTRGLTGRKRDLTEGGIRMPTLLEWPAKIRKNINTSYPAVSNDILPTIVEALGVQRGNAWPLDGISLMPLINDPEDTKVRPIPIGHATGQPGDAFPPGFPGANSGVAGKAPPRATNDFFQHQFAWTENDMKVWVHYENELYIYRLYNITADPYERHDLSKVLPDRLEEMSGALMLWYQSVLASSGKEENNCRYTIPPPQPPHPAPGPPGPPRPPPSAVLGGWSNMRGLDRCKMNTSSVRYVGDFTSYEPCQRACEEHKALCSTWTWHNVSHPPLGCYDGGCYLRQDSGWHPTPNIDCVVGTV